MKDDRLDRICQMVRTLKESPTMSVGAGGYTSSADAKGPVAGFDPVINLVDRRKKKQKNYPKEYVQMYRDLQKGNRLKSVMT
jgi:acetoin utilization deacetylase AcuC-like enzyme